MKTCNIVLLMLTAMLTVSCGDDEESSAISVEPESTGSFVDERDGNEYNYVSIGGLDWMTENSRYDLYDEAKCKYYISYEDYSADNWWEDKYSAKYGYLYTYQGAIDAAPDGWRVPTDDDWKSLEMALGMSKTQADATEWRGTSQSTLMQQSEEGTMLAMRMGGYYSDYIAMGATPYRFMGTYGFYWTSTMDENKGGEYYFYRKLAYYTGQVYRESMEPTNQMLSVRFVRDAQ